MNTGPALIPDRSRPGTRGRQPAASPQRAGTPSPGAASPSWTVTGDQPGEPALSPAETAYVEAARAPNTLRSLRSAWAQFEAWCATQQRGALPAEPATVSGFLVALAQAGAKVGTIANRRTAIKVAHTSANLPDPTAAARVAAVWEGIRRQHGAPPEQAPPLMPPQLHLVTDACPTVYSRRGRPDQPSLAGARDRALLLLGFHGALRRSELAALTVEQIGPERPQHDGRHGRIISLPRSKTNQASDHVEYVGLLRMPDPRHCPLAALDDWLELAGITNGPVLRKVSTANRASDHPLHPESINKRVHAATVRAGLTEPYSAHSLRAGFVTYLHMAGATDREIATQTRHADLNSVSDYVRLENVFTSNAVTRLGAAA